MKKNYWRMRGINILTVPYAYVDHSSYLADSLFVQGKVRIKYQKEMIKENSSYCIIFCKVLKRDVQRFEEALEKLKDKMLLLGYKTYSEECDEIARTIEKGKIVLRRKGKDYDMERSNEYLE